MGADVGKKIELIYDPKRPKKADHADMVQKNNGPKIAVIGTVVIVLGAAISFL